MINIDGYYFLNGLETPKVRMTRLVYYQRIKHTLQKIRNNVQAPQNFNLLEENIQFFFCELAFD